MMLNRHYFHDCASQILRSDAYLLNSINPYISFGLTTLYKMCYKIHILIIIVYVTNSAQNVLTFMMPSNSLI